MSTPEDAITERAARAHLCVRIMHALAHQVAGNLCRCEALGARAEGHTFWCCSFIVKSLLPLRRDHKLVMAAKDAVLGQQEAPSFGEMSSEQWF